MNYTKVAQLESPFEAEVLKDMLEEKGLPFIIHPNTETAYSGLFVGQNGWGRLLAPKGEHDTYLAILKDVRRITPEPPGGVEENSEDDTGNERD